MATVFLLAFVSAVMGTADTALHVSAFFADHMVLQRAPQQPVLWGTASTEGSKVTVQVKGQPVNTTKVTQGQWKVMLPAMAAGGPHVINVSSVDGVVTLTDVMFGDVWLCSGEGNMVFPMSQIINSTQEIKKAANFSTIRFTRLKIKEATTPQSSAVFDIPWTAPNASEKLGNFSSVCFLFGEYLQASIKVPIGLVQSTYNASLVKAWSGPTGIKVCNEFYPPIGPKGVSTLWNAMMYPLFSATITGVIWYQGESDVKAPIQYRCLIEQMLEEWRTQFNLQSLNQTSAFLPFGYVQLSPGAEGADVGTLPRLRWAQTVDYGYSPNPELPVSFMAVTVDLPDFDSPHGPLYSRYKQDVARRLALGARSVAYNQTSVAFQGPSPSSYRTDVDSGMLIYYDEALEVRNNVTGFEVCCTTRDVFECDDALDQYVPAPILPLGNETSQVYLNTSACGSRRVVGFRYAWRTSPCQFQQCALYDKNSNLPHCPWSANAI